jgi:hypothetical protein
MKIALITGGQPRFTQDFLTMLGQLKGFDSADVYMTLWASEWAYDDATAESKVAAILPPNVKVGKIQIVKQPSYELPPHTNVIADPEPENVQWCYKRQHGQCISLTMAFDLIEQDYDAVIRFRLDGCLDRDVDLTTLDLVNNDLILPAGPLEGWKDYPLNDQFAIGTQDGMKFYTRLGSEFRDIVPLADPNWSNKTHGTWTVDYLFGTYFKKYDHPHARGEFQCRMNTRGRSKFTDKHYHHQIVPDPTEK